MHMASLCSDEQISSNFRAVDLQQTSYGTLLESSFYSNTILVLVIDLLPYERVP